MLLYKPYICGIRFPFGAIIKKKVICLVEYVFLRNFADKMY